MRLGFIGGWGHHNLRALLRAQPAVVEAFAVSGDGHDDARAQKLCEAGPGFTVAAGQWFDDARQMLDQFKPDVVSIGAVYGYSSDFIAEALARDMPVVSDKPAAATWEQYQRLVELTTAKPARVLVTEFSIRSHPAFRAARQAVSSGRIGEVVLATGQKSYRFGTNRPAWYANRQDYAGTILWVASHAIDYLRFASGRRYTRVYGQQANVSKTEYGAMEEYTVSVFELDNGATGLVHADYNRPAQAATHGDDRLRIAGSRGVVEVRDGRCRLITADEPEQDITESVQVRPAAEELLAAVRGESEEIYGTRHSLEMARVLLTARDAADRREVLEVPA